MSLAFKDCSTPLVESVHACPAVVIGLYRGCQQQPTQLQQAAQHSVCADMCADMHACMCVSCQPAGRLHRAVQAAWCPRSRSTGSASTVTQTWCCSTGTAKPSGESVWRHQRGRRWLTGGLQPSKGVVAAALWAHRLSLPCVSNRVPPRTLDCAR